MISDLVFLFCSRIKAILVAGCRMRKFSSWRLPTKTLAVLPYPRLSSGCLILMELEAVDPRWRKTINGPHRKRCSTLEVSGWATDQLVLSYLQVDLGLLQFVTAVGTQGAIQKRAGEILRPSMQNGHKLQQGRLDHH